MIVSTWSDERQQLKLNWAPNFISNSLTLFCGFINQPKRNKRSSNYNSILFSYLYSLSHMKLDNISVLVPLPKPCMMFRHTIHLVNGIHWIWIHCGLSWCWNYEHWTYGVKSTQFTTNTNTFTKVGISTVTRLVPKSVHVQDKRVRTIWRTLFKCPWAMNIQHMY